MLLGLGAAEPSSSPLSRIVVCGLGTSQSMRGILELLDGGVSAWLRSPELGVSASVPCEAAWICSPGLVDVVSPGLVDVSVDVTSPRGNGEGEPLPRLCACRSCFLDEILVRRCILCTGLTGCRVPVRW